MHKTYKLRTTLVFLLYCSLYAIILINLYSLQIRQHAFFTDLARRQYYVTLTTKPPRASIVDRHGEPLALNKESLSAFLLPQNSINMQRLKHFLRKQFPQALDRLRKHPKSKFLYVKRRLCDDEKRIIEKSGLEDIHLLSEPNRFYPLSEVGTITGITNIDNEGLFGLEMQYQDRLSGTPTTYSLEKDARSGLFYFAKETTHQGKMGEPLKLTIDGSLQYLVHEELKTQADHFAFKEAAAIVMNPENGEILAMASLPAFDPHEQKEISLKETKNTAVTESYEFGSVLKVFVALAAIDEGSVFLEEEIDCENKQTTFIEKRRVSTVEQTIGGWMTLADIIKRSNNIGIAKIAFRLQDKLYDHYRRVGFGTKTGITFPGEQAGFINPPHAWSKQSIFSLSYGYEIRTTLLQLARAFCIFANGGYLVTPHLVLDDTTQKALKIYSDESIKQMRTILEQTTSQQGTGRRAALQGYTTLGKTGTANLIIDGHYDQYKNIYSFFGSVEKGAYKRVIACFAKDSPHKQLYASTTMAPLFKRIAEKVVLHEHVW